MASAYSQMTEAQMKRFIGIGIAAAIAMLILGVVLLLAAPKPAAGVVCIVIGLLGVASWPLMFRNARKANAERAKP